MALFEKYYGNYSCKKEANTFNNKIHKIALKIFVNNIVTLTSNKLITIIFSFRAFIQCNEHI